MTFETYIPANPFSLCPETGFYYDLRSGIILSVRHFPFCSYFPLIYKSKYPDIPELNDFISCSRERVQCLFKIFLFYKNIIRIVYRHNKNSNLVLCQNSGYFWKNSDHGEIKNALNPKSDVMFLFYLLSLYQATPVSNHNCINLPLEINEHSPPWSADIISEPDLMLQLYYLFPMSTTACSMHFKIITAIPAPSVAEPLVKW